MYIENMENLQKRIIEKTSLPKFLKLLSIVTVLERISYYGVRTLLVLFLIEHFGFQDARAYGIYSLFSAFSYAGPIISGILADRFFGYQKMIIIGGLTILLGQFFIMLGCFNLTLFFLGLGMLVIGTGFMKSTSNTLLGECYEKYDNTQAVKGFTIFHVAVNIGAALSSIICGYISYLYGWLAGFMIPFFAIAISMAIFIKNLHVFKDSGLVIKPNVINKKIGSISIANWGLIGTIMLGVISGYIMLYSVSYEGIFSCFGILMCVFFINIFIKSNERKNLLILLFFVLNFLIFSGILMQLGCWLLLFSERNVAQSFMGIMIPSSVSQSLNPVAIILFGSLIAKISTKRYEYSRFVFGLASVSLCFFLLYYGCFYSVNNIVSYWYFLIAVLITGVGELIVWPFVQYQVTRLSPNNLKGFMMGFVMLSISFSNVLGIYLAKLAAVDNLDGKIDIANSLIIYQSSFLKVAIYYSTFLFLCLPILFWIKRNISKE